MARTIEEWQQWIKDYEKRKREKLLAAIKEDEANGIVSLYNLEDYDYSPKYREQDSLYDSDGEYRYNSETERYDYYPDWLGNSMTEESFWETR